MTVTEFSLPDLGEGLTESEIVAWRVAVGDTVSLNQIIAEVETAKALVELPSPVAGTVSRLLAEPGETVEVGAPIVVFETADVAAADVADMPVAAVPVADVLVAVPDAAVPGAAVIAPAAAAIEERQSVLVGYGPRVEGGARPRRRERPGLPRHPGRTVLESPVRAAAAAGSPMPVQPQRPASQGQASAPATVFLTVDVSATMSLIGMLSARSPELRFTPLTIVAKAVCLAIPRTPAVVAGAAAAAGAAADTAGAAHCGVDLRITASVRGSEARDIRSAERMDLRQLAEALESGGTHPNGQTSTGAFAIVQFGGDGGTPVLDGGAAAALAVGAVRRAPWEHDGALALREVLTLTLAFDPTVVDSADAARFLGDIGLVLCDPAMGLTLG